MNANTCTLLNRTIYIGKNLSSSTRRAMSPIKFISAFKNIRRVPVGFLFSSLDAEALP